MTYERRDPDDPDFRGEPTASDVDAAFAQIIAAWDDARPQWPADDSAPTEEIPTVARAADVVEADAEPSAAGVVPAPQPIDEDDDHFVPPEPPPLPRPQPATVGAVLLFALGVVLLAVPNMIGFSEQYGLPLGLLSITGAIVWLVARLRQGPPTDSGWDDGAQL